MTGRLLPEWITLIHEADGVRFRETTGSLCILCFMKQSRSTPSKESEHPSSTAGLLTQKTRVHTELQTATGPFLPPIPQILLFGYSTVRGYQISVCIWTLQLPNSSGDRWSGDGEAGPLCPGRFVPMNSLQAGCWSQCLLSYSRSWVHWFGLSENLFLSLRQWQCLTTV